MSQEIISTEERMAEAGMQLSLVSDPEKQIENATRACTALMKVVEAKHLYEDFGQGKKRTRHLKVEAWLLLSHFYGVTPKVESVMSVQDDATGHFGFEATVEAIDARGMCRGRAVARCMSNEENWGMVAKYEYRGDEREKTGGRQKTGERQKAMQQLESMAQTRATSKVLSMLFRYVVILGTPNVSGTPAEEMTGAQEKKKPTGATGAKRISDGQRKRLFAIAHEVGFDINKLPEVLHKHGFEQVFEVTADRYDAVIADIQNWEKQPV